MCSSRALAGLLTALSCAVILWLCALVPVARGDGDPASDVLLSADVFYPFEPAAGSAERALNRVSATLVKLHDTVKVAIIAAPSDLGAVTSLFDKPQAYAKFVDVELSYSGPPQLLVVMPDGYGSSHLSAAAQSAVARLPRPGSADPTTLVRAAITAELAIARADGHPIAANVGRSAEPSARRPGAGASRHHSADPLRWVLVILLATVAVGGAVVLVLTGRRPRRLPQT